MASGLSRTELSAASTAYSAVAALYPDQTVGSSSPEFATIQQTFWNARQREKTPVCFFQPTSGEQVSKAIVEVVRARSLFTIKGGGHSSNADGSSIHGGFQFDLAKLNHVEIAADKKTLRVGPGMRWGELFPILESHGLTTVGGRDAQVGIPGFVFGGGLSYHSTRYGWGIDNLVSADVVLANGQLITVDRTTQPDLNRALHGGGAHNFGIVTSLTLKLYPFHGMWGGFHIINEERFDALFDAYNRYTQELATDGIAHMIIDFYWENGALRAAHFMGYPEPVADPPIYDEIRRIPHAGSTLRLASYSDLIKEMEEVTYCTGKRNVYWTFSMEYDIDLLRVVLNGWAQMTKPYSERFRFAFDVNHITAAMRNKAAHEGQPNLYGLEGPDEPLTNILLTGSWEDPLQDEQATSIMTDLGLRLEAVAKARGKSRSFKYMNYAHQRQDVIAGFGEKSKAFLKQVAAKYDPNGVFQKLQQGGFKLDGPLSGSNANL